MLRSGYINTELLSASKLYCCRYLFCLESNIVGNSSRNNIRTIFTACVVLLQTIYVPFRLRSQVQQESQNIAVVIKYSESSSPFSHETWNPLSCFGNRVLDWEIVEAKRWHT